MYFFVLLPCVCVCERERERNGEGAEEGTGQNSADLLIP